MGTYEQHMERRLETQLDGTNWKGVNGIENKHVISIINIVSFFLLFSFALFIFWGDALLGARLLMIGNPGRVSNTVPSYYKAVVMYILF